MVNFLSSLASYFLLMIIIVVLCTVAGFIGITIRKSKNQKQVKQENENKE